MLDIKFVRENPELVKENIKKKFQDHKLPYEKKILTSKLYMTGLHQLLIMMKK